MGQAWVRLVSWYVCVIRVRVWVASRSRCIVRGDGPCKHARDVLCAAGAGLYKHVRHAPGAGLVSIRAAHCIYILILALGHAIDRDAGLIGAGKGCFWAHVSTVPTWCWVVGAPPHIQHGHCIYGC